MRHPSLEDRFDPAVRMVDHDPAWAAQAEEEIARLAQALGPVIVRIDHIGSTAVPGLAAKPIIDLQVSVADLEPEEAYVRPLQDAGYLYAPDPAAPDHRFFARPPERPRSHHVHVCRSGSSDERRHLAVRDFLREHDAAAAAYEALKRDLVARHPSDRIAYMAGKAAFMQDLEARALRWLEPGRVK